MFFVNMLKVNPYNKQNVSFSSIPLFKINVKQLSSAGNYNLVPAVFSKFDPNNAEDMTCLKRLKTSWSSDNSFSESLIENFIISKNVKDSEALFYGIELLDEAKNSPLKLLSLAQINMQLGFERLFINYIASNPVVKFMKNLSKQREIKGAGENCVAGIINIALANELKGLSLLSRNNSFWLKLGFHIPLHQRLTAYPCASLKGQDQLRQFVQSVQQKYSYKFD